MDNPLFKFPSFSRFGSTHKLRVADILSLTDEEEEDDPEAASASKMEGSSPNRKTKPCSSPRRMFARWLQRFREKRGAPQTEKGTVETTSDSPSHRMNDDGVGSSSSDLGESNSEMRRTERNFNLGIGVGLLYMIAASKNELDKMVELRKQMEMFLKNGREELKREDKPPNPSEASEISSCSNAEAQESSDYSCHYSQPSYSTSNVLPESDAYMVFDHSSKSNGGHGQLGFVEGMDQLQAELEVELERLQLNLDAERRWSEYSQYQWRKDIADPSSLSSGEVINPHDNTDSAAHSGISPRVLERRLHELLEGRQQERIRELEAALESAIHKLHEKNLEVSWWKDTARIMYRHIPQTSGPDSESDPDTFDSLQ